VAALRGAFLKLDAGLLGFLPNIIVFQFNPESVSRSPALASAPPSGDGSGNRDANAQTAEPTESISFMLRLDANDELAEANPIAAAAGVLPALSALELLLYPKGAAGIDLFGGGPAPYQNPPQRLPTVLFFWGPYRILPVLVSSLSVTETEYDQVLNPVRAEVSVSLEVMTPTRLEKNATFARGAYAYSQGVKAAMAGLNLINPPDVITKALPAL
jgi:hypothetical protein